jgi:hypothetical protein
LAAAVTPRARRQIRPARRDAEAGGRFGEIMFLLLL